VPGGLGGRTELFCLKISVSFGYFFWRMSRQAKRAMLAIWMSEEVKNFIFEIRTSGSKNSLCWKKLESSFEELILPV